MLEQLKALAKKLTRTADPVDPSIFGDPLATRTSWDPAVRGGTNIGTHKLCSVPPDQLVFGATRAAKAFSWVFILVGLLVPVGVLFAENTDGDAIPMAVMVAVIFTVPFTGAGLLQRKLMCKPRTFDRRFKAFWKGKLKTGRLMGREEIPDHVPFDRIRALQIIKEFCASDGGGYYSYELNLVLDDASRVNVVDHGNIEQLRKDTQNLSEFLGELPIWDATL